MIYVRVELWRRGDRSKARLLGEAEIANDGKSENPAVGDYAVRLLKSPEYAKSAGTWKAGRVEGFPRQSRLHGPWDLLLRALLVTVGTRNRDAVRAAARAGGAS